MTTSGGFDKGGKMRRLEEELIRPDAPLKQVGAMLTARAQLSFKEQKLGEHQWAARKVPNVFGIVADFAAGKQPPARRFEARPALIDKGATGLRGSITWRPLPPDAVEVGTVLPYAKTQQEGGDVQSARITSDMQKRIGEWLRRKGKDWRAELGWLCNKKFTGKTLKGKVPPRPFVGITPEDVQDVAEIVGVNIGRA